MIERLIYWVFKKEKDCRACCLKCEYYDLCKWDTQHDHKAKKIVLTLGRGNGKGKLLYRINGYLEFKERNRKEVKHNDKNT